jgi:D-alanyl-lipoteichoic acid acyltransferase DltB (MBOAT superfamily)
MQFNSIEFFLFFFFVITLLVLLAHRKYQLIFLLAVSYIFYITSSGIFVYLLVLVSLITYITGEAIFGVDTPKTRKLYLILGTAGTLAILGYFKYYNFGVETFNSIAHFLGFSIPIPLVSLALPIGISFYTFSGLSYIFDIYRGKLVPTKSFCKYAVFIAYFPHLLAGPIVRASQFLPQLKYDIQITPENLKNGITLIVWGFIKKFVIADNIAPVVTGIFSHPTDFGSFYIVFGALLFGIQIFCDFSGYCDIAIGLAKIIGLHLPLNFFRPYLTKNPTEFWRRWNITLSSFIRDYVYIPLGGNRKGSVRTYLNLIMSMLLCGLWHGAAWNFIIWGGYHGILLSADKVLKKQVHFGKRIHGFLETHSGYLIKILVTQYFIFLGWLIFRVKNLSDLTYCIQKFVLIDFAFTDQQIRFLLVTGSLTLLFFVLLCNRTFADRIVSVATKDWVKFFAELPLRYWILYLSAMMLIFLCLSPATSPQFIYFQF